MLETAKLSSMFSCES